MHKNYCTNFGMHDIMSITKDDKCLSWVFYNFIRRAFYNDMDSIAYVLCEVLTSQEKARARKAVKNGGFFTFGYNGLYCCNSLKESTVKRFFKKNYNLSLEV